MQFHVSKHWQSRVICAFGNYNVPWSCTHARCYGTRTLNRCCFNGCGGHIHLEERAHLRYFKRFRGSCKRMENKENAGASGAKRQTSANTYGHPHAPDHIVRKLCTCCFPEWLYFSFAAFLVYLQTLKSSIARNQSQNFP